MIRGNDVIIVVCQVVDITANHGEEGNGMNGMNGSVSEGEGEKGRGRLDDYQREGIICELDDKGRGRNMTWVGSGGCVCG